MEHCQLDSQSSLRPICHRWLSQSWYWQLLRFRQGFGPLSHQEWPRRNMSSSKAYSSGLAEFQNEVISARRQIPENLPDEPIQPCKIWWDHWCFPQPLQSIFQAAECQRLSNLPQWKDQQRSHLWPSRCQYSIQNWVHETEEGIQCIWFANITVIRDCWGSHSWEEWYL